MKEDRLVAPAQAWKTMVAACTAGAAVTIAVFIPLVALPFVVFALASITFLYTQLARKTKARQNSHRALDNLGGQTIFLAGGLIAWALAIIFPTVSPVLLPAAFTSYLIWLRPTRSYPDPQSSSTSTDDTADEKKQNSSQSNR